MPARIKDPVAGLSFVVATYNYLNEVLLVYMAFEFRKYFIQEVFFVNVFKYSFEVLDLVFDEVIVPVILFS